MVVPAKKEIPAIRLLMAAAAMVCCFGGKEVSGNVERNRWWKWRERSRAISVMAGTSAAASLEPREEGKCGRKEGVPEGGREGRFADHGKSEGKRELEHALHGNEGGARLEGVGEEWLEGSGELGLGNRGDPGAGMTMSGTAAAGLAPGSEPLLEGVDELALGETGGEGGEEATGRRARAPCFALSRTRRSDGVTRRLGGSRWSSEGRRRGGSGSRGKCSRGPPLRRSDRIRSRRSRRGCRWVPCSPLVVGKM